MKKTKSLTRAEIIDERVIKAAEYYITTKDATFRSTAEKVNSSPPTIFRDFRMRLPKIDNKLAIKVAIKINKNLEERSSRGGQSTARKWANKYLKSMMIWY